MPLTMIVAGTLARIASAVPADVWAPSSFRTAMPWTRGVAVFGDLSEGRFQGRRLFIREASIQVAPTDRLAFWVGESQTTAFGRSSDSRFRSEATKFALRYRLGASRGTEFAVQGDYTQPDDAVATTGGGSTSTRTVYRATRLYSTDLIASRGDFDASLGFGFVDSAARDGRSLSASLGYRHPLARDLSVWVQGTVIGQSGIGATTIKSALRGQVRYAPVSWGAVVLEGTVFPNGLPYGETLGSFLLYNPAGSAAQGLKTNALGYGTLRLSFNARF